MRLKKEASRLPDDRLNLMQRLQLFIAVTVAMTEPLKFAPTAATV